MHAKENQSGSWLVVIIVAILIFYWWLHMDTQVQSFNQILITNFHIQMHKFSITMFIGTDQAEHLDFQIFNSFGWLQLMLMVSLLVMHLLILEFLGI